MCAEKLKFDPAKKLEHMLKKQQQVQADEPEAPNLPEHLPDTLASLSVKAIKANPRNIRQETGQDGESIDELAQSIQAPGLLEPLSVEPVGEGRYQVLCGHRRLLAVKKLGWTVVPCMVKHAEYSDKERVLFMLIENLQREDLSPLEEAEGYARLLESGLTRERIAQLVGKSRTHVSKALSFRERLTEEEKEELKERATSHTFARLDESTRITDPELRQEALFTDMPIREIRERRKQEKALVPPEQPKEMIYKAELREDTLRASLKIQGRQMTKEEVFPLAHKLAERLCKKHQL